MNLSTVLQQSGVIESMAKELGIDEATARAGAGALLPAIVAGMGRQSTSPGSGGLGGLADILAGSLGGSSASSSGGLGGIGGVLLESVLGGSPTPTQPGNDILGEIFGSKDVSRGVAEEVSGFTGIGADLLKRMLPILAMAVVGYMTSGGQSSQSQSSGGGGLGSILGSVLGGGSSGGGNGVLGGALGTILTQVVSGMTRR